MQNIHGQSFVCPQYRQIDRVDKVSALFEAGISRNIAIVNSYTVSGISQTSLSEKLSPPKEPIY